MNLRNSAIVLALVAFMPFVAEVREASAAMELNFSPTGFGEMPWGAFETTGAPFDCPDAANPDCKNGVVESTDGTTFYYERIGGGWNMPGYWHMIIGDPNNEEFSLEVWVPLRGWFRSPSGGREPNVFSGVNLEEWSGNGWDPLGISHGLYGAGNSVYTGNGTGDPSQVWIRQLMGTGRLSGEGGLVEDWICDPGQMCQEFLKAEDAFKPRITQDYVGHDLETHFEIDMSEISYSEAGASVVMVNTVRLIGGDFPKPHGIDAVHDSAYFDIQNMPNSAGRQVDITAGKYIYTPGIGYYDDGDGDGHLAYGHGSYAYEGGYESDVHINNDWDAYYNSNTHPAGAYPGNMVLCEERAIEACFRGEYPY